MIKSFGDKTTDDIANGRNTKKSRSLGAATIRAAENKIYMLDNAQQLDELKTPPNNRLEALKGKLKGYFSIRINQQYRLIFKWKNGEAFEVRIVDYHR